MSTVIFTVTLNSSNAGNANACSRVAVPVTGASLGQVRVTFSAGNATSVFAANDVSIGVGTGIAPNTASTPVQLFFNGQPSFTITGGGTIVSDWANFNCLSSDTLVVDIDEGSSSLAGGEGAFSGATWYGKASTAAYNQATVSGFATAGSNEVYGFSLIETQAPPPPPPLPNSWATSEW
jgi:hypothetical protein